MGRWDVDELYRIQINPMTAKLTVIGLQICKCSRKAFSGMLLIQEDGVNLSMNNVCNNIAFVK